MSLRVLIAGGGTGGHVIPALAIARELRDTHHALVSFLGTARGLETRLVPEAGFPLELIRVGQLNNVSLAIRARTIADLPLGLARCVSLLRRIKPDVVVGVGGYASGPAVAVAILLRIPTLAFEPNAVPGLANRLIGKRVSAAAVNFAETAAYFRGATVTGIPVRREFFDVLPKTDEPLRLLVFGGSQGAQILNRVFPLAAARLQQQFPELEIVHQAGGRHAESTAEAYRVAGSLTNCVRIQPYLDAMVQEITAADLVMCRSGASTVAELAAAGKPSVLIPFAAAADDHQRKNAEVLVHAGAAVMVLETSLTPGYLAETIADLLRDREQRKQMSAAARNLAFPNAAATIGRMCVELNRSQPN